MSINPCQIYAISLNLDSLENPTNKLTISIHEEDRDSKLITNIPSNQINLLTLRDFRVNNLYLHPSPIAFPNLETFTIKYSSIGFLSEETLKYLNKVKKLSITETPLKNFPKGLGSFEKLKELKLSDNKLESLPEDFFHSTATTICLDGNPIEKLPDIPENSHLENLDVEGCEIEEIPESIGNALSMTSLVLDDTDISYLPKSIEKLKNLKILSVLFTKMTGLKDKSDNPLDLSATSLTELKSYRVYQLDGAESDETNFPEGFIVYKEQLPKCYEADDFKSIEDKTVSEEKSSSFTKNARKPKAHNSDECKSSRPNKKPKKST